MALPKSEADTVANTLSSGQNKHRKLDTAESPDKLSQLLDTPVDLCAWLL